MNADSRRLLFRHLAIELENSEAALRRDHQFRDGSYERVDAIRRTGSPINIRHKRAHLILQRREDAEVMAFLPWKAHLPPAT